MLMLLQVLPKVLLAGLGLKNRNCGKQYHESLSLDSTLAVGMQALRCQYSY